MGEGGACVRYMDLFECRLVAAVAIICPALDGHLNRSMANGAKSNGMGKSSASLLAISPNALANLNPCPDRPATTVTF